jgi:hypothetical protein
VLAAGFVSGKSILTLITKDHIFCAAGDGEFTAWTKNSRNGIFEQNTEYNSVCRCDFAGVLECAVE